MEILGFFSLASTNMFFQLTCLFCLKYAKMLNCYRFCGNIKQM